MKVALDALNEKYTETANAVEVKETVKDTRECSRKTGRAKERNIRAAEETDHAEKTKGTGTGISSSLMTVTGAWHAPVIILVGLDKSCLFE